MSPRPVLIVDALNLFIRHFVANPMMNESGDHVGGFVGFLKSLGMLCERTIPKEVIVVWEGGGSPRRRAILKNYKDKRRPVKMNRYYDGHEIPDTLENRNSQISLIIEALGNLPCNQIYVPDCEADDIISRVVKYSRQEDRKVIVSSDKDLYQLLSRKTIQWSPGQKKYITPKTVAEKFGLSVENFCTARSFIGDQSDKIKGVKGAGFSSLVKRFPELSDDNFLSVGDVVALAKHRIEEKKLKLFENIIRDEKVAKRNWRLMYLDTTNISAHQVEKIDYVLDNFEPVSNKIKLIKLLKREGVNNFNIDAFFVALTAVNRK